MALLLKSRVVGPLYRRQQRFSDGSSIPEGEKVDPYVLRKKKITYFHLHALLSPIVNKHLLAMIRTGAHVDFQVETGTVQRAARPDFSQV